jgi:hypothetical protein
MTGYTFGEIIASPLGFAIIMEVGVIFGVTLEVICRIWEKRHKK